MRILHVDYKPVVFWAHKLLNALNASACLKAKHREWPRLPISTLAFSIETRVGALREIICEVDQQLNLLGQELKAADNIDKYIEGGYAYSFKDEAIVRRVLIGTNSFITECRSCYENLADFYREFMRHYFSEQISERASYKMLASVTRNPAWAADLRKLRHEVLHDRAPWLAFEKHLNPPPEYEPILVLNLKVRALESDDYVSFKTLREIRNGLEEAAIKLRDELISRVRSNDP